MPRGTIDWKSTESYTRLLAALLASQDLKPNYKRIADYYGEGATYDSIEGRFRIIRKDAEKLKTEVDTGARAPAPARGTNKGPSPRKPRTPKGTSSFLDIDTVLDGRITKSANATPTKRRHTTKHVIDLLDSSAYSSSSADASVSGGQSGDDVAHMGSYDDMTILDSFNTEVMPDMSAAGYNDWSFDEPEAEQVI